MDFIYNDPSLSRHHATLKISNGELYVKDICSKNGSYIDAVRIEPLSWVRLEVNNHLAFGDAKRSHFVLCRYGDVLTQPTMSTRRVIQFSIADEG